MKYAFKLVNIYAANMITSHFVRIYYLFRFIIFYIPILLCTLSAKEISRKIWDILKGPEKECKKFFDKNITHQDNYRMHLLERTTRQWKICSYAKCCEQFVWSVQKLSIKHVLFMKQCTYIIHNITTKHLLS